MSAGVTLTARDIVRSYRKSSFVLDVAEFSVAAGDSVAILGPSGSGKSTLLHILGLLERPDTGDVLLDERPVQMGDRRAQLSMAAVFQRPYLFKGTVAENVAYGLIARGVPRNRHRQLVRDALERVGLAGYESRGAFSLSGGEQQRVSLARALVLEPAVLLLDEPLASLDPLLKRQLTRDFATILRDQHVTVVYVTHDQEEALVVADKIAVMNEGRIVAFGPADDTVTIVESEWTAGFLGVEPAIPATIIRESEGLLEAEVGGENLFFAADLPIGSRVLLSVRPEDVLLFETGAKLPLTTARNRLTMSVTSIESRGSTLRVTLDANGARLASSVSRASARELELAPGVEVLAVFKATAVRWREMHSDD